jgi:hypothetical protein
MNDTEKNKIADELCDDIYARVLATGGDVDEKLARESLELFWDDPDSVEIHVVDSPDAAQRLGRELLAESRKRTGESTDGYVPVTWSAYLAGRYWTPTWIEYLRATGEEVEPIDIMYSNYMRRVGASMAIALDRDEGDPPDAKNHLILVQPYTVLKVDHIGEIHSEDGPAVAWRDGQEEYAWHGVFLDDKSWIAPGPGPKAELAFTHENMEMRRIVAEILGWEKVLADVPKTDIHADEYGELFSAEIAGRGRVQFVRVKCATGRIFILEDVGAGDSKTALEAVAKTYQMTPEQYSQIEART